MNDKPPANRSRRPSGSRRKTSQFDTTKARSQRSVAEKSKGRRKDPLASGRGGRVHQALEGGTVIVAFVQPMQDPETGREWERVFLFGLETEEDMAAAEAWLEKNYPPIKEDGQ